MLSQRLDRVKGQCALLAGYGIQGEVLANVLYMIALSYYHYLSFLGYSALPFLEHTEVFLWPVAAIVLVVPFAVLAGFNPSRFTLNIYFG